MSRIDADDELLPPIARKPHFELAPFHPPAFSHTTIPW
jgi:hypothetical protein